MTCDPPSPLPPERPICPCTPRDSPWPSSTTFFWPILLTYLSTCLHCSGTTAPLVGLTYLRASMCIFNPFNHGKCSAGITEFNPASTIQLNIFQAPHDPQKHKTGENFIQKTAQHDFIHIMSCSSNCCSYISPKMRFEQSIL